MAFRVEEKVLTGRNVDINRLFDFPLKDTYIRFNVPVDKPVTVTALYSQNHLDSGELAQKQKDEKTLFTSAT